MINRRIRGILLLAVALCVTPVNWVFAWAPGPANGQSAASESWRRQEPEPEAVRPFSLPPVRRLKLQNGLTIVTVEDHRSPIITFDIAVPAGSANDPAGSAGLAAATAELLTAGAAGRSSQDLAGEIERLGGQISSSALADYTEISVSVLSENGDRLLAIAGEVLLKPDFPADEVQLYKDNRIETVAYQRQDPAFVAKEYFNRVLYGSHPYAVSSPTPESIASLSRVEIEEFYKRNYTPLGSIIAIVGDFNAAAMEARAKATFAAWKTSAPPEAGFAAPASSNGQRIYLIDRPGSEQTDIRIGNLAASRSAKDFLPLVMANTVLGGGGSSRLFVNVRERKGYAYDISSSVDALRQSGSFFVLTQMRNDVVVPAIREMLAEFDRIRNSKITAEDLEHAKNYVNGTFSLSLSTQAGLAGRVTYAHVYDLGADFLETFRDRVNSITADQVQQAAQAYILPDHATIVVVGDAASLKKSLDALGPVQIIEPPKASANPRSHD
jgi:zinc protease